MAPKPPTFGPPRRSRGAPLITAPPPIDDMGARIWPPSPPTFGPPRRSRGAPLITAPPPIDDMGAPIWPPSPQRSARPGEAVARLSSPHLRRSMTWGPRYGPQAPNVRPAPAKPWRAATELGEHRAVGTERVRDEAGGEERRAHALGLGRVGDRDDDAREPQCPAVLGVERADHRMVLGGPRGHTAAHEAAEHGPVEHLVRMNDRRQHAPHGIAVEDAFVEAVRALEGG